jgi:hypothetical protein
MKRWLLFAILGLVFALPASHVGASSTSNWPSLNADGAQSNSNPDEKMLSARNVLRLKVAWALPIPTQSYPVVRDGVVYLPVVSNRKIHVRAVEAATGKPIRTFTKDASGGLLATSSGLVLAGKALQLVDPATGQKQAQIDAPTGLRGGKYLNPTDDSKVMLVGYATASRSSTADLYTVNPESNTIVHTLHSATALGTFATHGRILTDTGTGGAFYDEMSGRSVARQPAVFGPWFSGSTLSYTVAPVAQKNVSILAYDGTGRRVWSRVLGPPYSVQDWPHAVTPTSIFVERVKPTVGVQALDPVTGAVLWSRTIADVQRLAEANGVLYVLSYALGVPVRIVALKESSGAIIGVIGLSAEYYAYPEQNDLMVADGMVFVRLVGPGNVQQLIALAPGAPTHS